MITKPEYEKFSGYFNLDNGSGKVRGIYTQGNESVKSLFQEWLTPFTDLGATAVTVSNTGGTDHQSFDGIGLPGFQFIQDSLEYSSRTHHSNMDVFDRASEDDLKQASVIMAASDGKRRRAPSFRNVSRWRFSLKHQSSFRSSMRRPNWSRNCCSKDSCSTAQRLKPGTHLGPMACSNIRKVG